MLITDWLRWFFIPSGIVVAEESGRISWLSAFIRLLSGGVKRDPHGPTRDDFAKWMAVRRPLKRFRCKNCEVYFWAWKNRKVCYKFSCYRSLRNAC